MTGSPQLPEQAPRSVSAGQSITDAGAGGWYVAVGLLGLGDRLVVAAHVLASAYLAAHDRDPQGRTLR